MQYNVLLATVLVVATPSIAMATTAVTTGTGAGFSDLAGEIDGLLSGPLGWLLMVASALIGATMLIVGNWKMSMMGIGGAVAIGYLPAILTSFAGVSATIDADVAALLAPAEAVEAEVPADLIGSDFILPVTELPS